MIAHRIHHGHALGLLVAVCLLLTLAVRVDLTGAASDGSGSGATGTLRGKVRIEVKGNSSGDVHSSRGRFTISGAISDRGRYIDSDQVRKQDYDIVRKLVGTKGTIWIKVGSLKPFPCQCNWRISKATGACTGLRGQGHEEGTYGPPAVLTMKGRLSR